MLRLEYPGAIYHITARGNERKDLFRSDADRLRFLEKLAECVQAHHIRLYAYVLMSNHFHLLLETPRGNLSAFMHQFNTSYTVYFNRRYGRVGHLLSGRYKAPVVEGDEYLLKLTRYVHLNPVKIKAAKALPMAERLEKLRGYRWSSYPEYAGLRRRCEWVDYGPLSELAGGGKAGAYRRYVEAGVAKTDEEMQEVLTRSRKGIGTEGFCRWVETKYREMAEKSNQAADVSMRRVEVGLSPEKVMEVVCREFGVEKETLKGRRRKDDARRVLMKLLKEQSGLTQREVAVEVGLRDGSGISRHLAEVNQQLNESRTLRRTYERIAEALNH